jgi:conjugative relaxase-like TrwC/TraI family protein
MLRVTTLYASTAGATAAYYTKYLTRAEGQQPGRWTGQQADRLGLSGEVTTEALQALLEGRDPISGSRLGYPLEDRYTASGRVIRAVAGFDATLSAPKSLSVWWALTADERLAECHDTAVAAVVDWVERYGSTTRVRVDGHRLHPETGGLTAAVFRQTTSRLDDPQLHSHVVISAKVQTVEGRWLALDARTLKGFQRALGGLYQSVLRAEVTARFGATWTDIDKGQAEIAGIPDELLAVFSKRTAQVDAALAAKLAEFYTREGRDPTPKERGALGREAAADTRRHKTGAATPDLRAIWTAEAAAVGVDADSLTAGIVAAGRERPYVGRVTVAEVIDELGERHSAWHRLDVAQAVCDLQRAPRSVTGQQWSGMLEQATDQILVQCVDLDPDDPRTARRRADGRSVWIEPSARHHTSPAILAQEEELIVWALDAQLDLPTASTTTDTVGLDPMQAEAAATVAGIDPLVLIVGPAGAGKTTMLRAAVADLHRHRCPVFGVAPTAKAARVLEAETGMTTDTLAKLLHEWTRPDRPPDPDWQLPTGCTIVVDEAGMAATGDLHTLTRLADQHRWRLVLVGDPHQLQAVGRGGMFAELCAQGRTIELDTIHRFTNTWEADASLKIRSGDPTGLLPYLEHDRIVAGPFAEHCQHIAARWLDIHARGGYLAITTATNDHVATINQTIQTVRQQAGQLGNARPISTEVVVAEGDLIVTRRNQRLLRTTRGESVRNRDYWTIDQINPDGSLAVTRIDGHGTVTLPAPYTTEHVQLGYAATEPGNQSDTATHSETLATPATTCRGLYTAITRGTGTNLIRVTTDSHDINQAIDILQHVVATDRADHPATRTRQHLAGQIPSTSVATPEPELAPRCTIPTWFWSVHRDARRELADARAQRDNDRRHDAQLQQRIDALTERLDRLAPRCKPHDDAIDTCTRHLHDAQQRQRRAEYDLATTRRRHRRSARRDLATATNDVANAETALADVTEHAEPLLTRRHQLRTERQQLQRQQRHDQHVTDALGRYIDPVTTATQQLDALNTWQHWATGKNVPPAELIDAANELHHTGGNHAHLAQPLTDWIHHHDLARHLPTPTLDHQHHPEPAGIEIDF